MSLWDQENTNCMPYTVCSVSGSLNEYIETGNSSEISSYLNKKIITEPSSLADLSVVLFVHSMLDDQLGRGEFLCSRSVFPSGNFSVRRAYSPSSLLCVV